VDTFLGLSFTPALYVSITALSERIRKPKSADSTATTDQPAAPVSSALA